MMKVLGMTSFVQDLRFQRVAQRASIH